MIIPQEFLSDETPYSIDDIDMVCNRIKPYCRYVGEKTKYLNIPISFDIETSSFYDTDGNKTAIMYIWFNYCWSLVGRIPNSIHQIDTHFPHVRKKAPHDMVCP